MIRKSLWFSLCLALWVIAGPRAVHAAPVPAPTPVAAVCDLQASNGALQITFQGQPFRIPAQTVQGAPYVDVSEPETARFLSQIGATVNWSADRKTLTLYGAAHYARWAVGAARGVVDGNDTAPGDGLIAGPSGTPLLRAQALAENLGIAFEARADGTYECLPVIEKMEMVRESGDRRIVLRATTPMHFDAAAEGTAVRLTIRGARWGKVERQATLDDVQVHSEGMGTDDNPIVVAMQMPEQWKGEIPSRFLLTEAAVRIAPAFRVARDYKAQAVATVDTPRSAGEQRVNLDFSGPIQYFWRFSSDTRILTIDIPQAQAVGSPTVDLRGPEADDLELQNRSTSDFNFLRLRVHVRAGHGFEVRTVADGAACRLALRFAAETFLPVTAMSGRGFEPPGNGNGPVIVIDPGHGGSDPGAINRRLGLREKDVTLDVSLRLRDELVRRGWRVYLTREDDRDLTWAHSPDALELGARVAVANQRGADLFVSIHCNSNVSSTYNGTSIHWFKSEDLPLARALAGALLRGGFTDRGPVRNRFFVLRHTQMPAVLVETAFISNPIDASRLADPITRQRMAEGLADALETHRVANAALNGAVPSGR